MVYLFQYLLEWEHSKTFVHSRSVGQERSQSGFEYQPEVECPISHSLMDDGVSTSFANDQIGPLYDDNRDEESGMASVFQDLPVAVCLKK